MMEFNFHVRPILSHSLTSPVLCSSLQVQGLYEATDFNLRRGVPATVCVVV